LLAPPAVAQSTIPSDETFTTNNVEVWEESIFTLRHNFENASSSIDTGSYRVRLGDTGDSSLQRDNFGVRNIGEEITLNYNPDAAVNSNFDTDGDNVQLIAARVTGSGEPVTTFSEAIDLISQENANTNATFENVTADKTLNGVTSFNHKPNAAGHYVYFVVDKSNNGEFKIVNGDEIEIASGTPTIIGVEQVTFQRGSPESLSAPAVSQPGDSLSFDIDVTNQFNQNDVTHTVLVYNRSTFSDDNEGRFTFEVSDRSDIDEDFNLSEDAELFHEINEVNGVADVEDGIEVNGIDISNGRVSRAVSLGSAVDFVAEDINGNPPNTTATNNEGNVRLNASVTANASRDETHTITVETPGNWSNGTYRYVYIGALESNASAVTTSSGTITFDSGITVTSQNSSTSDSSGNTSVIITAGSAVSTTDFSGLEPGTTASVAELQDKPSSISATPNVDSGSTPTFIEINAETQTGSDATVEITVDKSQFNNVNNARVFRFNGTQFNSLPTSVVSETSNEVTLQFSTRFSTFAIGEVTPSSPGSPGSPSDNDGGGGGGGGGFTATQSDGTGVDEPNISSDLGDQATITAESEPIIVSEDNTRSTATFADNFPLLRSVSFVKTDTLDDFSGTVNARAIDGEPTATGVPEGTVVSLSHITMPDQNVSQVELRYEVPNSQLNELGASEDELTVRRFDGSDWQEVDVEAGETENSSVVTAQLSETTTSYFALMAPAAEDDETAAGDGDGEDGGEGEEPSSDDAVPGFGIIVSLVSIIAMVVVISRRN
jgi:hypothetical protein